MPKSPRPTSPLRTRAALEAGALSPSSSIPALIPVALGLSLVLAGSGCGGAAGSDPGPAPPAQAGYRVVRYEYAIDLDTRVAHAAVRVVVESAGNCLSIGLRTPTARDVLIDGAPAVEVLAAGGRLDACRAGLRPWPVGATAVLEATVELPAGPTRGAQMGLTVRKDRTGAPFTYLLSWVGGCDLLGPCDAAPDRFATYRFTVDHAAGTEVLCPGRVERPSPTRTTCDFAHPGGPTYSTFGVMASPSWTATPLGAWSGVGVTLYDYPGTNIAKALDGTRDGAALSGFFAWAIAELGPYPYGSELRLAVAPTYWAGFEHPGNIALAETLAIGPSSYANGLRHTVMHELAHQWAGDRTTLADTYDFVWKEAMAEYLSFVYEDEHVSPDDAQITAAAWKGFAARARYYPVPAEKPALLEFYGDAYGPGPLILFRQMEVMYGRPKVMDAIRALVGGAPRAIGVDDVRRALEATTGASLGRYFDAWVRGRGLPAWPRAKVSTRSLGGGGGDVEVTVDVSTADGVRRGCAFHVRLLGAGGARHDVRVDLGPNGDPPHPITARPGFVPTGAEVDPFAECLVTEASAGARSSGERAEPWRACPWPAPDPAR